MMPWEISLYHKPPQHIKNIFFFEKFLTIEPSQLFPDICQPSLS